MLKNNEHKDKVAGLTLLSCSNCCVSAVATKQRSKVDDKDSNMSAVIWFTKGGANKQHKSTPPKLLTAKWILKRRKPSKLKRTIRSKAAARFNFDLRSFDFETKPYSWEEQLEGSVSKEKKEKRRKALVRVIFTTLIRNSDNRRRGWDPR